MSIKLTKVPPVPAIGIGRTASMVGIQRTITRGVKRTAAPSVQKLVAFAKRARLSLSYTPLNVYVFDAAFSGALAGSVIALRGGLISSDADPYQFAATVAGAWASALDTAWGNGVVTDYIVEMMFLSSQSFWMDRSGNSLLAADSETWTSQANDVVGLILEGQAYLTSQGIVPPPWDGNSGFLLVPPGSLNLTYAKTSILIDATGGNQALVLPTTDLVDGLPFSLTIARAPINVVGFTLNGTTKNILNPQDGTLGTLFTPQLPAPGFSLQSSTFAFAWSKDLGDWEPVA